MSTQYDPTTFGWQNFYSAVLQSDITSGSLTLTLDTVPASTSGIVVIEPDSTSNREVILYTSKGASTITCPADGRGWAGSTAVAHLTGSTIIMADVSSFFQGLSDGSLSTDPLRTAIFFDHIASGGVVAQSAGLIGTFANIVFYLNGRRYSGASIANKTYTASKDTYVDITGNSDGSVTVTYTEVSNNTTSPALSTNNIRVAIVTTSGAAITNVNQGQESQVVPVVSSVNYSVNDGLGNLICPRDPQRKVLGYRQIIANYNLTSSQTTPTQITGLSCPVIVPSGRKVKVTLFSNAVLNALGNNQTQSSIWDGVVNSGTKLNSFTGTNPANNGLQPCNAQQITTPTSTTKTYNGGVSSSGATNVQFSGDSVDPGYILVELV